VTGTSFVVFVHVLSAFLFVAGLVGRNLLMWQARGSGDIGRVQDLVRAAGPFERLLVIPGSMVVGLLGILAWWAEGLPLWGEGSRWVTVSLVVFLSMIPLVPLVFLPKGKVFESAMEGAVRADQVTPELTVAFHDPVVDAAHAYELVAVAVIILLMVTKPF
jgi:uncharacterized membrane protein